MGDWLRFLACLADAQAASVKDDGDATDTATHPASNAAEAHRTPALNVATEPFGDIWHVALRHIIAMPTDDLPDQARTVVAGLAARDTEALARAWLDGRLPAQHAGEAPFIVAALQVVFATKAAALDMATVHLLPQRGLCPVCASPPVAGVITAAGRTPGVRYLHCGLCAAAWNHVRAVCTGCGETKGLTLQEVEGGTGAIKAETCGVCHGYAKVMYQAKDMAVEPMADDLASLGLDMMVSEAGWSRLAPNPLIGAVV